MNTTNKQDETLEPLDLLVNELRQSNVRQYTCVNDSGYSQLERNIVTILTTWQKEQDKVIIDKLKFSLTKIVNWYKVQESLSFIDEKDLKESEQLLQSLK